MGSRHDPLFTLGSMVRFSPKAIFQASCAKWRASSNSAINFHDLHHITVFGVARWLIWMHAGAEAFLEFMTWFMRRILSNSQGFFAERFGWITFIFWSMVRIRPQLNFQWRCQDWSVARFLRINPMVTGLNPTSANLSLRIRRVASSL